MDERRSRKIKTLDLELYSKPDQNRRVRFLGMVKAREAFDLLEAHLHATGFLDGSFVDYFDCSEWTWPEKGDTVLPVFSRAACSVSWGANEGVYLEVLLIGRQGVFTLATAKTLRADDDAFLRMHRVAAECSLMLNGGGVELSVKEGLEPDEANPFDMEVA